MPTHDGPDYLPEGPSASKQVQDDPAYAGMVQSVDESVGRVLAALKSLELEKNTVVIFMSDNGGLSTLPNNWRSPTSNVPLRAGKGWLYEGGIREPMIIKWPGVTKAGSVCHEPVTSTDFYPTMLQMAGLPPRPRQHVDGLSLVPLLKGGKTLDREAIFWHYPHYHGSGSTPAAAVRAGRYKLIQWFEDDRVELYDLEKDPGERRDLSRELPEVRERLLALMRNWREQVGAKLPRVNPDYKK